MKKEFLSPIITSDYVTCVGVNDPSGGSNEPALITKAVSNFANGSQAD